MVILAIYDLRGHIVLSAQFVTVEETIVEVAMARCCESKVDQKQGAILANHVIVKLDVSMNYALVVNCAHYFENALK